jgi:hypothetical protein
MSLINYGVYQFTLKYNLRPFPDWERSFLKTTNDA